MRLEPRVLAGQWLRMEPLCVDHAADLWSGFEPQRMPYLGMWIPAPDLESWTEQIRSYTEEPGVQRYAMVDVETGRAVGSSSYLDIRLEHRSIEIGATWIAPSYQGTRVNPESKLLMLSYAFEELGCNRVQLKTDLRNLQSQSAIEKLGARKEGVLRRHMICRDGYVRDTVMYSIVREEWVEVRESLLRRLR